MIARLLHKALARQYARPSGLFGRLWIANRLDRISRSMNRLVFEQLELREEDRVLEVGFGGGDLLEWVLASASGETWGVDISEVIVARARRRFRRQIGQKRVRIERGSVERLPLPDRAVDKAVSVNNLYFWPDAKAGMAELARVVRPGGRLLVSIETPESLRSWPGHRYGFTIYGEDEVTALMEGAGFTGIEISTGADPALGQYFCARGTRQ